MRRLFFLVLLLSLNALFAACSKKTEKPAATEAPPETAGSPTATAAPTEDEQAVPFSLSGEQPGATTATTAASAPTPRASSTLQPAAPAADDSATVQTARWLVQPNPFYPLSLRMQGIEGRVDVRILINTEGRVDRAEVIASTEPRYNDYAVAAMRASRFIPQRENGKPVPLVSNFSVNFISEFGSGTMSPDSPLARLAYQDGTYYAVDKEGHLKPAEIAKPIRLAFLPPLITPSIIAGNDTLRATIKVTVTEEGQSLNPSVTDASNPEFAKALEEVLPFWEFLPEMRHGKPARVAVQFPYTQKVGDPGK